MLPELRLPPELLVPMNTAASHQRYMRVALCGYCLCYPGSETLGTLAVSKTSAKSCGGRWAVLAFGSLGREIGPRCLSVVLLLLAFTPLVSAIHVTGDGSNPSNCQPGVQNEYPANATVGEKIMILTTVTNPCIGPDVSVSQVIVNILRPGSSEILSTAPASPATNVVTAPRTIGPWALIVQVLWNGSPASGILETFQTTITINIIQ